MCINDKSNLDIEAKLLLKLTVLGHLPPLFRNMI